MEKWDIFDLNRIVTGCTMVRGENFKQNSFHLVVHICIFNSVGEMLIQQRQISKKDWPEKWDVSVGGSAISGETSGVAATRELHEELGISIDLSKSRPNFSISYAHGFDDWYIVKSDIKQNELVLQAEEVLNVSWASKDKILKLIDKDLFIPYYKSLIEFIFESKNDLGGIRH